MDNEQIKKPIVRFPNYKSIVDKVFGAGNLDSFEYEEAEALVSLAKEELLKDLMQEAVDGEVIIYGGLWQFYAPDLDIVLRKLDEGDKVKIIIVKEN